MWSKRKIMVELSGKDDPFQHAFSNSVFIIPALVVGGLAGKLRMQINTSFSNFFLPL